MKIDKKIIDLLKNTMILLKYMKVDLISNNLIQVVYLRSYNNRIFRDDYFIDIFILFAQYYNIDDLNKYAIQRLFRILHI